MGSFSHPFRIPLQLRSVLSTALLLIIFLLTGAAAAGGTPVPTTLLISKAYDGSTATTPAGSSAYDQSAAMSADGRYVAFVSNASNLASGANGRYQVFVRDRSAGTVEVVSRSTGGTVGNGDCKQVTMTPDGRYVVFSSDANNLVDSDHNGSTDIFLRDRTSGTTQRVSISSSGAEGNQWSWGPLAVSPNGRWIVFNSESYNLVSTIIPYLPQLYLHDVVTGSTELVSVSSAGQPSNPTGGQMVSGASISADGRYIAFDSSGTNLVPGDTNQANDVFLRDRLNATTTRVNLTQDGSQLNGISSAPSLSADGRYLAFATNAPNLVGNGGVEQVFVRDLQTGTLEMESVTPGGAPSTGFSGPATLSQDGRYVAFGSNAPDLLPDAGSSFNAYVRDRQTGVTSRVSEVIGGGPENGQRLNAPLIPSADGNTVLFCSDADGLAPGSTSGNLAVYVRDHAAGVTQRMSEGIDGTPAVTTAHCRGTVTSADGRYIAYLSDATNLVPGDTNGHVDAFVYDCHSGATERASVSASGSEGDQDTVSVNLSADGRYLVFGSLATNLLVTKQAFGQIRVFLCDRLLHTLEEVSLADDGTDHPGLFDMSPPAASADGRFVVFAGRGPGIAPGDSAHNGIYVRDRFLRTTECLTATQDGQPANSTDGLGGNAGISADGRYVAFQSDASNLVSGDTNGQSDVFVRDRLKQSTERVSTAGTTQANGASGMPTMSADGRIVYFWSFATNLTSSSGNGSGEVYRLDRGTGALSLASIRPDGQGAHGGAGFGQQSADGGSTAFLSEDSGLVAGDTNGAMDVFVRDYTAGTTERVNVPADGGEAEPNSSPDVSLGISGTGAKVVFCDNASNLTGDAPGGGCSVFLRVRRIGTPPSAPSGLSATLVPNPLQVRLDWSDLSDNEALFRIERSSDGGSSWTAIGAAGANLTAYADTGLALATTYLYRVRAANEAGDSDATAPVAVTTPVPLPPAPTALKVTTVSASYLRLDWQGTVNSFRIERKSGDSDFSEIGTTDVGVTTYFDGGLSSNTTYTYRVRAHNSSGDSGYAGPASGTTQPFAPTNLQAVPGRSGIQVQWFDTNNPLADAEVDRSLDGGTNWVKVFELHAPPNLSPPVGEAWTDEATQPSTTYAYRVRFNGAGGPSAFAGPVSVTSLPPPPSVPTGLTATADTPHSINVSWSYNGPAITTFDVQCRTGLAEFQSCGSVVVNGSNPGPAYSIHFDGLNANTTYDYRVRANNAAGPSDFASPASATTPFDPPNPPSVTGVSPLPPTQLKVSWSSDGLNIDHFVVERKSGTSGFAQIGNVDANARSYTDTGLTGNSRYAYRVRAHGPGGEALSPEASGVTFPAAPSVVVETAVSAKSVTLTWSDPNGTPADTSIERSPDGGTAWAPVATVPAGTTRWTDGSVLPETTYQYRLRCSSQVGMSSYTDLVSVTTPKEPLGTPAITSATAVNDTRVDILWSYSGPAPDGFRVLRAVSGGELQTVATTSRSDRSYSDTGLSPGIEYTYEVQAYRGDGSSAASAPATATTWADPPGKLSVVKSVQFGSVRVGTSKTVALTLKNTSKTASLAVFGMTTTQPFGVVGAGEGSFLIPPGGTHTVQLSFAPSGKQAWKAELEIVTSQAGKRTTPVELKGTGK